jgi:YcxB-like protein
VTLRYRYLFNAAYCKTVISRFYRQRAFYLRLHYQFAAIALILLLAWSLTQAAAEHSSRAPFIALCVTGAAILGFMFLVRFAIMFKLRKSREFGKEVTIALTDEGLEASGSNGRSSVKWSAYPRSVRFSDGILLTRGGAIRWLPDSSLEEGDVQDVIALIRGKTTLRSIGVL